MQKIFIQTALSVGLLILSFGLPAQLITTNPAAPTEDQPVTITFDATQGTAGLANCSCDVYLHTGVITNNSTNPSDWKYVQTEWGVANAAWKLTPVAGESNKFTYTYGPSIREYFSVPAGEDIEKIAFVFRNADGTIEGKATGGTDIFVDVSAGGNALGVTVVGDPGQDEWALGRPLPVLVGATRQAELQILDNGTVVASRTGVELSHDLVFTTPGEHRIVFIATTEDGTEARDSFSLDAALVATFTSPAQDIVNATQGALVSLEGTAYIEAALTISDGTTEVFSGNAGNFNQPVMLPLGTVTTYTLTATYQGETATDVVTFVTGPAEVADPPAGFRPGASDQENGDVLLQLRAPGKSDVFVVGNFNDWTPTADSRMKKAADDDTFWLTITGLEAGEDLIYHYLIDGTIRQPDPYSTLVLDPNNDRFIAAATFAEIPEHPNPALGILSWHRRGVAPFNWQTTGYERPDPGKMVVYELLLRDFLQDHSFKSLTDTLDYLERLGVNAIELMPVSEFENNNSWGYNVSFHMALDKYYGSPEDLKTFVDAAHSRGMAVILDVVYNHAFGQSPLARMWWDEENFRPTFDNPYLNPIARHPFNVGYDFNHENPLTKEYVKVTTSYWLEEFRVDGFRFDLSKGFTQLFSGDNVGFWNQYDPSRVAIIKDYADNVWNTADGAYMIMEHLAEELEEKELAEYGQGMYFWSGFQPHDAYLQSSMGFGDNDIRQAIPANRGFSGPNLVAYMESHDEERMQFKNEQFGNSAGNYNIKDENTGLDRIKLASAFFYTVPGPKMLWQFGELGYDFSINYCPGGGINNDCRVDPKPIRWDYRNDFDRAEVYNVIADLLYLRNTTDFFHGEVTKQQLNGLQKILNLSSSDGEVAVVGNFNVTQQSITGIFPSTGNWYDYFSGETLSVSNANMAMTLAPGEFHVFLSSPVERGGGRLPTSLNDREVARLQLSVFPNPTAGELNVAFELAAPAAVTIDLMDATGRQIQRLYQGRLGSGAQRLPLNAGGQPAGLYFLRINDGSGSGVKAVMLR